MSSLFSIFRFSSALRRVLFGGPLLCLAMALFAPPVSAQVETNFTSTNVIHFERAEFFAREDALVVFISVIREGPLTNAVTVSYSMADATAITGIHYFRESGSLFFLPGQNRQQFPVIIIDNFSSNGDVFLNLSLFNPGSGGSTFAMLGEPSEATLTIIDDEAVPETSPAGQVEIAPGNGFLRFGAVNTYTGTLEEWLVEGGGGTGNSEASFSPYGPGGVQVTIVRRGGSRGRILVDWQTTTNITPIIPEQTFTNVVTIGDTEIILTDQSGGLADPFAHFIPTNGTVVLNDYQMSTNIVLPLPRVSQFEPWSFIGRTNFLYALPYTVGVELTGTRAAPEEAGQDIAPTLGQVIRQPVALLPIDTGFSFTRMHFEVNEGQRYVRVRVRRSLDQEGGTGPVSVRYLVNSTVLNNTGGNHQWNTFPLEPASDYTTPFVDYEPPGTDVWRQTIEDNDLGDCAGCRGWVENVNEMVLQWGDGEVGDKFILIPLIDDDQAEFNEDIFLELFKFAEETDGFVSQAYYTTIKIRDNDQPAGASDVTFNPDDIPTSDPPHMLTPGANNTVQAVAAQPDGKVVLGGDFTAVNTYPRRGIARMNFDGSIDHTFTPGTGIDGFVRALALQPDGKILVGGLFDSVNGIGRRGIARLLTNGVVDPTFNPGIGVDGAIRAITVQEDGKILIGGEFLSYNGTNRTYIARLEANGSLDTSFDPGEGPNAPVNSIAVSSGGLDIERNATGGPAEDRFLVDTGSSQGTITVNYDFINVPDTLRIYHDGNLVYDSGLINGAGTIIANYGPGVSTYVEIVMNEGSGEAGTIWYYDLQIDPLVDQRPVIGGEFTEYDGHTANFITRLNLDGSIDETFSAGTGADDVVHAVAKQGNKIILAGDFETVDLRPRKGVARLNEDGSLDLAFEPGSGFNNTVMSVAIQPSGRPVLGGTFTSFNGTRRVGLARLNLDGTLDTSFMDTAKNQFAGVPNPLSPENVQSLENFIRSIAPYRLTNINVLSNIVVTNDMTNLVFTTNIVMSDHLFVGGRFSRFGGGFRRDDIRPRLNIARVVGGATPGPGNIAFASSEYRVDENAGQTYVTLVRTNGSLGPIGAEFEASDVPIGGPGVAIASIDYQATNYFPIWIRSHDRDRQYSDAFMGPNNNTFSTNRQRVDFTIYPFPQRPPRWERNFPDDDVFISVFDDNTIEGDEVLDLSLVRPDGMRLSLGGEPIPLGAALGKPDAQLTIIDNDFNYGTLGFTDADYFVDEEGLVAVITLSREGGASGAVTVDFFTQHGTADGEDYDPITRRQVFFPNGATNAEVVVRIQNDTAAELEETVQLFLTNPTGFPIDVPPNLRLDPERDTAVLNIIDDDFLPGRLSFTQAEYEIDENAGEVTVFVRRAGGNFGEVFVNYATVAGDSSSAVPGEDYVPVSGTLHWVDEDSSTKSFTIPLLDNMLVGPDKTILVELSGPTVEGALGIQPTTLVRVRNDDAFGTFSFSQPEFAVDENGPYADITVLRENGLAGEVAVSFAATNLTAIGTTNFMTFTNAAPDFVLTNGVLQFAPGESSKAFRVYIIDDPIVEGEKRVALSLSDPVLGMLGMAESILTIVDDELNNTPAGELDTEFQTRGTDDFIYSLALQPDGKILLGGDFQFLNDITRNRLGRLMPDGSLDPEFRPGTGPNDSVRSIELQDDSRILASGLFTVFAGTNRSHITRLNIDGKVDPTFHPGQGTDNPVYATVVQPDGKILIGGEFTTYRGITRRGIARVNTNGVIDATFDPGTGADGTIYSIALQGDGKILVGGDFNTFDEVERGRLVRLNPDGSVDTTFAGLAGTDLSGPDGSVRAIVVQPDNKILIGGLFENVHGQPAGRVARLNPDGTLDTTFAPGPGANGPVNTIALQIDGRILLGGNFTEFNGRTRNRITRLNSDGSLDPTINFGAGANATVSSIVIQPDRKILLAGGFTEYDGQPANRIARIHGGSIAGSGRIQFTTPFFRATETATNAVVTLRRTGGTTGEIEVRLEGFHGTSSDSDVVLLSTNLVFPEAEAFRTVLIPVLNDALVEPDETVNLQLSDVEGGDVLGAQPNATLTIESDDSQFEFSRPAYSVTEDFVTGSASITVRRLGFTGMTHQLTFVTSDGTASAPADYQSVSNLVTFEPGQTSRTFAIPVFDDLLVEGNETVRLTISNLVGDGEISGGESVLTIVDNDFAPGELSFTSEQFAGEEGSGVIVVTVQRRAGTTGVISADYSTRGVTATPRVDYIEGSGIVSFADGETLKSFTISVIEDDLVEGNEDLIITLSNPKGGAVITGSPEATGTIVDDDLGAGSLDHNFNPAISTDNPLIRVVQVDEEGEIYVGGAFSFTGEADRDYLGRLLSNGAVDPSFSPGSGPSGLVADIAFAEDGKIVISGDFNTVGGVQHNRVARLHEDGSLDPTFFLPLGLNAEVSDVEVQPDGRVLIGGMFDVASAAGRNRIARLLPSGLVDTSFNPGTGANDTVHAVALQSDGKVVIGGRFTSVNGVPRGRVARLNSDGSVDTSFNTGAGANGPVYDVLVQSDGKIVIAGDFTSYNGNPRVRVARLNADGSLDDSFNPGEGPNAVIYALGTQPDGKYFIAGDFTTYNGQKQVRVARLNIDGSYDPSFNPGDGPNAAVRDIEVQPLDAKVLIGGAFTTVDRVPRGGIARFNNDQAFVPVFDDIEFGAVQKNGGSTIHIEFSSQPGFTYALESSANLVDWVTVRTISASSTTTAEEVDITSAPFQFFRVRRVAP